MSVGIQTKIFDPLIDLHQSGSRLTNKKLIRSVSNSQHEILRWIQYLYCPEGFELDCTYHKGRFYRHGIDEPKFKMDIFPRSRDTIQADVATMPFKSDSFQNVIFDPPFFCGGGKDGHIKYKYGAFESLDRLWQTYRMAMHEIYRVLKSQGILVFKCQDFIHGRQQFLIHADIIKYGQGINFYPKDLFITVASHVPISWNHNKQIHCRKTHSYFIIFQKKIRKVRSFSIDGDKC